MKWWALLLQIFSPRKVWEEHMLTQRQRFLHLGIGFPYVRNHFSRYLIRSITALYVSLHSRVSGPLDCVAFVHYLTVSICVRSVPVQRVAGVSIDDSLEIERRIKR